MELKHLNNTTTVDLDHSRCVWDNGVDGDARIELWADADNVHVWAETNGDPVYGDDSLRACLTDEGLAAAAIDQIVEGDLSGVKQTKYSGKPSWSLMADELWDSDGCQPDAEQLVRCMSEFRDDVGISDYYFVDVSEDGIDPDDNPELYRDSWNNDEVRASWECGPEPNDIDFTGLDEAIATQKGGGA